MAKAPLLQSTAPVYDGEGISGSTPIATPASAAALAPIGPQASGKVVNVVDPQTGETFGLDEAYLAQAQAQGYKVETAQQAAVRQYVNENKGISGTAKVALASFADEATFGVGGALHRASMDPFELAKWEALKKDHEVANIAGGVAGFGTSLLYGGELFGAASKVGTAAERAVLGRALAKSAGKAVAADLAYRAPAIAASEAAKVGTGLARKMLAGAAKGAGEGLVLTAPKAMTEAILGDPERAAETWLYGAAAGGVFGAGAGLLGGVAAKARGRLGGGATAQAAEGAIVPAGAEAGETLGQKVGGKLREAGDDQVISSLNFTQKYSAKLKKTPGGTKEAVKIARENELWKVAGDPEAMAERVQMLRRDVGERIGAIYETTGEKAVASVDDIAEAAMKPVLAARKQAGKVSASETVEKWVEKELLGPQAGKIGTLKELHELRQAVDKATKWDATVSNEINELRKEVRDALTGMLEDRLTKASKDIGRELLPELKVLNKQYGALRVMADGAEHNVVRGMSNRRHSLTDYLGNQIGATVGGFVGGGVGSLVGGYVGGEANNVLRRWAPGVISEGLYAAADLAEGRGLRALESSFSQHGEQLAHIPKALAAMSEGRVLSRPAKETFGVNVITRLIGAPDKPASRMDHTDVAAFADKLASLSTNPAELQAKIEEAVAPLGDTPEVGIAVSAKAAGIVQYLAGQAPKRPDVASPFQPTPTWRPSDGEMKAFRDKVEVALNPYAAIDRLSDKTLTQSHVDALKVVAPKLYDEMVKRVMEHGASGKAKPIPFAYRVKLSQMLGVPLDRSIAGLAGYQDVYAQIASGGGQGGGKPSKLKGPALETDVARLTNK